MANKVLIGIVAIALIGGAIFAFSGSEDETDANQTATTNTAQPSSQTESTQQSAQQPETQLPASGNGAVVGYSADALANSETENNLLFFHAAWCTVCNSVERSLEAASIPDDLTIFKVDYDSNEGQALAKQHNIPIQYSMVQVDTAGNEITQWVNQFNDGINEITGRLAQS